MEINNNNSSHYLTTEDKKSLASKGVGGTALGLGIAGTALGLLNGGLGIFNGGLFGNRCEGRNDWHLAEKENADYIEITKNYYQNKIDNLRELTESFYALDQKIQIAKDIAANQSREQFDSLNKRIIDLEKKEAVQEATQPLLQVINDLKINNVNRAAQDGICDANHHAKALVDVLGMQLNSSIAFEAERRRCADNTIVNYTNATFYPKYIADITTKDTTTQQPTYNPLMQMGTNAILPQV